MPVPSSPFPLPEYSRRRFLYGLGASLGSVALTAMLRAEERGVGKGGDGERREGEGSASPLAARPPHHAARAKACIFLFMEGGPSHLDTFDPKPKLRELHMREFERKDRFASAMASGKRYYVESPFTFRRAGESGIPFSSPFEHLPSVADELCLYLGCQAESINHPTACYHMNTGNRFGGEPAVGSWVTYGLGTENENLPAFVVLPENYFPQGGGANWSNGYLPPHFHGTPLRPLGSPILDLAPPPETPAGAQRANLNLLGELERAHAARHAEHEQLAARLASYELAYRMQREVPELLSLEREDQATLELYGVGGRETDSFARRCLLARKLVESGVRFVQVYAGGWDSHDYIERAHANGIRRIDRPIAALLTDLKRRGLLDSTLLVWCGEFGRSPDNGIRGGKKAGRDHNARAMPLWLAGGGCRAGSIVGATDELGGEAVEAVHPIRNLHCTLLHLLGLNDADLTYFHAGRFKQLSQVGGSVIRELVA